ncbi:polyketide cyclase [Bacterioplanes sanyensis]|uniref:Polyketide cyclase n=1 Tax=Bacterioplanes sanyensis TaxID=1249553 RepID=A0A222FHI5_9GAMM|nr:nuclear transport factor 2 family protein [Bacterioplanes sanyensis]ASP38448.1 polyketide cyclase [Bacterioplanes sanyensis]
MTAPRIQRQPLMRPHWSDTERANAEAVLDFVQLIMNDHRFDEVLARFGEQPYRQHNRTIADGIGGVVATLRALVKTAPEFSYEVKRVLVDGDQVILHSHATLKAKHRGDDSQGLNIVDIWMVEDGRLVEHWDAVQGLSMSMRLYGLLTGGQVRNANGVF